MKEKKKPYVGLDADLFARLQSLEADQDDYEDDDEGARKRSNRAKVIIGRINTYLKMGVDTLEGN